MAIDKVASHDAAMARVKPGMRVMMGEFVGAGEPARCIEWLLEKRVGDLTLIAVTPGVRGGFLMGKLFEQGQISELISTHVATSNSLRRHICAVGSRSASSIRWALGQRKCAPVQWG